MHVNVAWSTDPAPTSRERTRMADGGAQLAAYFRQLAWPRDATSRCGSRA